MTTSFNQVTAVTDWAQHDQHRAARLAQLAQSESLVEKRKLHQSAEHFQPSPALLNAINAALVTRTPLLLTGEAGTGKTQVAWYLKRYFDIKLFEYQVHSNSQAKDMRYDFDAVAYLRDAYLAQHQEQDNNADTPVEKDSFSDARNNPRYLQKGALWQAYLEDEPSILLIDEVDKAPRDFPNDLLQELDQNRFAHPFNQGEHIESTGAPPITIITSNGERRLPDAFLRRCMVHHIQLDTALLTAIVTAWQGQLFKLDDKTQQAALSIFQEIRKMRQLNKKPATAELLLWLSVLSAQGITEKQLINVKVIPLIECLIKDDNDRQQVEDYYEQYSASGTD